MTLYPDRSLQYLVLKDLQAVLAIHQFFWEEQRDGNPPLDLNSPPITLFITNIFLSQALQWAPESSPTSAGVNRSLTYRIFLCEEIWHIYFYTHFTALCFTAEADDSLIPVFPFARPLIVRIFSSLSQCWRVWGMPALRGSREDRTPYILHPFSLNLHWSRLCTVNNAGPFLCSFHDLMMQEDSSCKLK